MIIKYIKILITIVLIINFLNAKDMDISFSINKKSAYQGEAILLDVNLSQLDHSKVMLFNFSIKKSQKYRFKQIDFREDNRHHNLQQYYKFLIYPISSGNVNIKFNMIKSITDDAKVAYSISGDRDNVKGLVKQDIILDIEPFSLDVQKIADDIDFIGDYQLEYNIDKKSVESYEPINLNIKIQGSGLPIDNFDILKDKDDYKIFRQKPKIKTVYQKEKSITTIEWSYAISSKNSFSLDKINLKVFNPQTKKTYSLNIPKIDINVKPINMDNLVDKIDIPLQAQSFQWDKFFIIISYLLVFIAGFLTPKDIFNKLRYKAKIKNSFEIEVDRCKTSKELFLLLIAQNDKKFDKIIIELESNIYQNININLKDLKNRLSFIIP